MLPISTIIGLQVGLLLSGAVLTETVFAFPGIGSWLVEAIKARDYPVIQGGVLFVAIIVVFVNLIVISYGLLNRSASLTARRAPALHADRGGCSNERRRGRIQRAEPRGGGGGGLWSEAWYRLRRNPGAIAGFVVLTVLVIVAIFAPLDRAVRAPRAEPGRAQGGCCPGPRRSTPSVSTSSGATSSRASSTAPATRF